MIPTGVLSTCRFILKQITLEALIDDGLAAMNTCFTGFTSPPNDDYVRQGNELAGKRFGNLDVTLSADLTAPRRFAGDPSLDRGRYFTLCKDSNGNDEGTLVRELLAYNNPQKSGLVTIIDTTLPEHQDRVPLVLRGHPLPSLLLLFPPVGGRPHPFAAGLTTETKPLYVTLPMRVSETEIDRVIDLRRPDTANWFAAALSQLNWLDLLPDRKVFERTEDFSKWIHISGYSPSGYDPSKFQQPTAFAAFPFKPPLESFGDLLPALLCQSIGGGRGAAQIAGLWLRKLGVNGLIFPSARSDGRVLVRNGEVVEWSGINFVDYRNTQSPKHLAAMDLSVGWPTKVQTWPDDWTENSSPLVYDTVTVAYENQGTNKGSWMIQGMEMRRAAPYRFLELAWLLEQLFGPDDPHSRNVLGLAYDFLQKMWRPDLSRDFVNALMGMPAARESLLRLVEGPFLDQHPDVRESVQIVLQRAAT
jgi:hypothetical protein